jgi:CheY-like chemotaxis protein
MAERVLVVDDDAPVRRMLERVLAAEGFEVLAAADGGAALVAAERSAPDLVVLDVAMPGLDGLAVCRRLRGGEPAPARGRCRSPAPALLTAPGALEAPAAGRQLAVEVLDRRERFVARSPHPRGQAAAPHAVAVRARRQGRSGFADVRLGDRAMRLFAAPLPDDRGSAASGAVLVASSAEDIEATLHRLGWLLVLSGALAAAVGAAGAALLTRRGLGPSRASVGGGRGDRAHRGPRPSPAGSARRG